MNRAMRALVLMAGWALFAAILAVMATAGVANAQAGYGCNVSGTAAGGQAYDCAVDDGSRALVCTAVGDAASFRFACNPRAVATPVPTAVPPTPVPTVAPTVAPPTAVPPTATPGMDMAMMSWHAPGSHSGIPAHEHGAQPPAWIAAAGYTVSFTHAGNTGNENMLAHKHSAFKGWATTVPMDGVDIYCLFHQDLNPGGAASRFHSYQCWFRDAARNVSLLQGWLDFGINNNTLGTIVRLCGNALGGTPRPVIAENGYGCPPKFSVWYSRPGGAFIDVGFANSPTYYLDGPNGAAVDPANPATWYAIPGGNNLTRRVEIALYAKRLATLPKNQVFYANQSGTIVSGPNDPSCGQTAQVGERSYPILCLPQYVASTLTEVSYPDNALQLTYPGAGVVVAPN